MPQKITPNRFSEVPRSKVNEHIEALTSTAVVAYAALGILAMSGVITM